MSDAFKERGNPEILVVDDTAASLQLLTRILTERGYKVRPATGGELALRSAAARTPDLILLDVKMPGMDGFEVCRRLKASETTRTIPVVFISASGETIDKVKGFEAGGVDYITKPFEQEEVLIRVRFHLRLSELTERLEQKVRERTRELTDANERLQKEIGERTRAEDALRVSERLLHSIINNSTAVIYVKDAEGRYVLINERFEELFHVSRESVTGKTDYDIFPKERAKAFRSFDRKVMMEGRLLEGEEILPHDGELHTYISIKAPLFNDNGRVYAICGISTDITERKRAEEAIKENRERFRNLVEATSDWVWEVDAKYNYTYVSPKVREILGYEPEEMEGRTPFDFMPREEARRVGDILRGIAVYQKPFSLLQNININKQGIPVILETSGVPFFNKQGDLKGYRGIDRDVTERKRAEETIKYQTYHDLLTGLPNRAFFMDILKREIGQMQRMQKRLVVMFLDLDCFKSVNESLGHAAGDSLLKEVSARLKTWMRETDTVARVGGDEFVILLPLINNADDATRTADKIRGIFHEPFMVDGQDLRIAVSIGISIFPEDGADPETLFKNADTAMHYAKDQGRNASQFFNKAMNTKALERIMLENTLRKALERSELVVYYQPQINIKSREIVGSEALVRWNHPELGLLKPMRFIPLAEEIGLIAPIDLWVLRVACGQLKAWQNAGYPLRFITVNLSARQFQQPDLPEKISKILKETGLAPESLGIEITETLAMQDTELTARNLNALNSMGIMLLIDDFGTGYSSLSYLKKLPIHKLKIDKSFISSMSRDPDYRAIIDAVIAMTHVLKLQVLAEGVETKEQASFLGSRECDEAQGNFYSEPIPAKQFEKWLQDSCDGNKLKCQMATT